MNVNIYEKIDQKEGPCRIVASISYLHFLIAEAVVRLQWWSVPYSSLTFFSLMEQIQMRSLRLLGEVIISSIISLMMSIFFYFEIIHDLSNIYEQHDQREVLSYIVV